MKKTYPLDSDGQCDGCGEPLPESVFVWEYRNGDAFCDRCHDELEA